jgi:hypothetical protein
MFLLRLANGSTLDASSLMLREAALELKVTLELKEAWGLRLGLSLVGSTCFLRKVS